MFHFQLRKKNRLYRQTQDLSFGQQGPTKLWEKLFLAVWIRWEFFVGSKRGRLLKTKTRQKEELCEAVAVIRKSPFAEPGQGPKDRLVRSFLEEKASKRRILNKYLDGWETRLACEGEAVYEASGNPSQLNTPAFTQSEKGCVFVIISHFFTFKFPFSNFLKHLSATGKLETLLWTTSHNILLQPGETEMLLWGRNGW